MLKLFIIALIIWYAVRALCAGIDKLQEAWNKPHARFDSPILRELGGIFVIFLLSFIAWNLYQDFAKG